MRIPKHTIKPRFYVATSHKEAFSSWSTLEEASACVLRFKKFDKTLYAEIIGIIKTDTSAPVLLSKESPHT